MPHDADGSMPPLLSQTGAFLDTPNLVNREGLLRYDLIVPFWSDGAQKLRSVSIPAGKIGFTLSGEWTFPSGTVFVKTFELATDAANPTVKRRLETRLLIRDASGGVYGVTYKWRADGSDADLLPGNFSEDIPIKGADGVQRRQSWYYPSREDCHTCHNARAGLVLGLNTRQLNKVYAYPDVSAENQLRAWNDAGLFQPALKDKDIVTLERLAALDDDTRSLEERGRSYLDANCSYCHQPGGTVAGFDARFATPLDHQGLVDGPILINEGLDKPRVLAPHDIWRSVAYMRVNTNGDIRMPPLARQTIDERGARLLRDWIESLPGRAVLEPPTMSPVGGMFNSPVEVKLTHPEPGADIHYTLDGSVPGLNDPRYERPIRAVGIRQCFGLALSRRASPEASPSSRFSSSGSDNRDAPWAHSRFDTGDFFVEPQDPPPRCRWMARWPQTNTCRPATTQVPQGRVPTLIVLSELIAARDRIPRSFRPVRYSGKDALHPQTS